MSTEADRKAAYGLIGKLAREAIESLGPHDSLSQGFREAVLEVARQLELAGRVPPIAVITSSNGEGPIVVTTQAELEALVGKGRT